MKKELSIVRHSSSPISSSFLLLTAFFVLFLSFILFFPGRADTASTASNIWEKTYGQSEYDAALCVQLTHGGGYIFAGWTKSLGAGGEDCYILKIDSDGKKVWEKVYGGPSDDVAEFIQQTSDGGYIVAGSTKSFGAGGKDCYIIRLDYSGNVLWQEYFGGSSDDEAFCVQQTEDKGYIVAGSTKSFGYKKGEDCYIIKLDKDGYSEWQKYYGGSKDDAAKFIQQTTGVGYIVAGRTKSYGAGGEDCYIIKLDSQGNQGWTNTYGGSSHDMASSIQKTSYGGYIIAGKTESFGAGGEDGYLIKLDSDYNTEWEKTYGGDKDDQFFSVQQTSDGGYIVAGETESFGAGEKDCYIVKLDSFGNSPWQTPYGGSGDDIAESIQVTSSGGYIIAGLTESSGAGQGDCYVIKIDTKRDIGTTKSSSSGSDSTPVYMNPNQTFKLGSSGCFIRSISLKK